MEELNKNGVEIYRFPTDDETVADINNQMNVRILGFNLMVLTAVHFHVFHFLIFLSLFSQSLFLL